MSNSHQSLHMLDAAASDGIIGRAAEADGIAVQPPTLASLVVFPPHANPEIKQVQPMGMPKAGSDIPNSSGSSSLVKRTASRDSSSLAEAGARAKAKAKVVPKPKQRKRNLRNVPSNPESRIAAIDANRHARNHPYLPPEPRPPDD